MTSSPPPPFDDGGVLPETSVGDRHEGRGERRTRHPNYLVRRAIAIGVLVVVLAGGSVLAGRIIGGGGGGNDDATAGASWNTVVVVADDEVRLVDPESGDVTATIPGDEALLDAESLTTGGELVLLNEFGRITEIDLGDGTIRRSSAPEGSTLARSAENASIVLAGPPIGGEVVVVDTAGGTTFDIGAVADLTDPLMFAGEVLVNRSGSHVAAADARSFQSVLVDVENETAVLLAGQVVALNDDTVVTAQRAGNRAELEFYDLDGERLGSADAPSPQVTMLTGDSTALVVAADGAVASVRSNGKVDDLEPITPSTEAGAGPIEVRGGFAALDSTRLLLETNDGVAVLRSDGVEIARAPGGLLSAAGRGSECVLIGDTRPTGVALQIALDTGEKLTELPGGVVASASVDGCVASLLGSGPRVVTRGGEVDLGDGQRGSITIAPDGLAYVLTTPTSNRLVVINELDFEPINLAREAVLVRFAQV